MWGNALDRLEPRRCSLQDEFSKELTWSSYVRRRCEIIWFGLIRNGDGSSASHRTNSIFSPFSWTRNLEIIVWGKMTEGITHFFLQHPKNLRIRSEGYVEYLGSFPISNVFNRSSKHIKYFLMTNYQRLIQKLIFFIEVDDVVPMWVSWPRVVNDRCSMFDASYSGYEYDLL